MTPFYVVLKENERYPKISGFPFLFEQGRFPSSPQKNGPPTTEVHRSDLKSLLTHFDFGKTFMSLKLSGTILIFQDGRDRRRRIKKMKEREETCII